MKNKKINLLLAFLFSWIIVVGTVCADTKCRDRGYNPCCQTCSLDSNSLGSKTETYGSISADSQYSTNFSFATAKNQFCCKDKNCKSEGEFFLGTQNASFQKQAVNFVSRPKPLNKDRASIPVFTNHKTIQTISIYNINQSFLC